MGNVMIDAERFKLLSCIRVKTSLSLEEARRLVTEFVDHYNTVRLQKGHRRRDFTAAAATLAKFIIAGA